MLPCLEGGRKFVVFRLSVGRLRFLADGFAVHGQLELGPFIERLVAGGLDDNFVIALGRHLDLGCYLAKSIQEQLPIVFVVAEQIGLLLWEFERLELDDERLSLFIRRDHEGGENKKDKAP